MGTKLIVEKNVEKAKSRPTSISFPITGSTTVFELQKFLSSVGSLSIELRTFNGTKLSGNVRLEDGKQIEPSPLSNTRNFETSIHSALTIAKNSNLYSEVDWVQKIFENVARKVNSMEEKKIMIGALVELGENNSQFTSQRLLSILILFCQDDSDYDEATKIFSKSDNAEIEMLLTEINSEYNNKVGS